MKGFENVVGWNLARAPISHVCKETEFLRFGATNLQKVMGEELSYVNKLASAELLSPEELSEHRRCSC